jgi:hypothetical protein
MGGPQGSTTWLSSSSQRATAFSFTSQMPTAEKASPPRSRKPSAIVPPTSPMATMWTRFFCFGVPARRRVRHPGQSRFTARSRPASSAWRTFGGSGRLCAQRNSVSSSPAVSWYASEGAKAARLRSFARRKSQTSGTPPERSFSKGSSSSPAQRTPSIR